MVPAPLFSVRRGATGGTIHGGGRYWWCVRSNLAHGHQPWQQAMQTHGCATTRALPNTTRGTELLRTCPPRMWHIVESHNVRLYDLQVLWAGYWTLHFQFTDQILVEGIHLWNPSNSTFNGPNGDVSDDMYSPCCTTLFYYYMAVL